MTNCLVSNRWGIPGYWEDNPRQLTGIASAHSGGILTPTSRGKLEAQRNDQDAQVTEARGSSARLQSPPGLPSKLKAALKLLHTQTKPGFPCRPIQIGACHPRESTAFRAVPPCTACLCPWSEARDTHGLQGTKNRPTDLSLL